MTTAIKTKRTSSRSRSIKFIIDLVEDNSRVRVQASCPSVSGESEEQIFFEKPILKQICDDYTKWSLQPRKAHAAAHNVGERLYRLVFQRRLDKLFQLAYTRATDTERTLRIVFRLPRYRLLHSAPWELLHDGKRFITMDPRTPLLRYLRQEKRRRSTETTGPLRILFTSACPNEMETLQLHTEKEHLHEGLRPYSEIDLKTLSDVSLEEVGEQLRAAEFKQRGFHVWHHCGHGCLIQGNSVPEFKLVFNKKDGAQLADIQTLGALIKEAPTLRMVVMNTCHGAEAPGLIPALAALNVPVAIGFRGPVTDPNALTFAQTLYRNIVRDPIDEALGKARLAMFLQRNPSLNWSQPVLYHRSNSFYLHRRKQSERPHRNR